MSDDREYWDDQQAGDLHGADDLPADDSDADDEFPLLSADDFDQALEALAEYASEAELGEAEANTDDGDLGVDLGAESGDDAGADGSESGAGFDSVGFDSADEAAGDEASDESGELDETDLEDSSDDADYDADYGAEVDEDRDDESGDLDDPDADDAGVEDDVLIAAALAAEEIAAGDVRASDADDMPDDSPAVDEEDRLRKPRAGRFRQTVRNQISMLPLSLLLIALGSFLLAREQDVAGLPDLDNTLLALISVITVGVAAVFHALLSGRRERGLLFVGLWILSTVGFAVALVVLIDDDPDIGKWWPLVLWSTALTLMLTYLIERIHDVRLIFLGIVAFVAGVAAYLVSGDVIADDVINDVAEYWPLLFTILGIGLLPLVFQRRTE